MTNSARLDAELAPRLDALKEQSLYRLRRVVEGPQGPEIALEGRRYLNFSSNDYLGLAAHPALAQALQRGLEEHGTGSGAAHLVTGHSRAHHAFEEELAAFTGRQRALLFSSGYMANLGVASALLKRGDRVLEDRLNHASLLDAGLLSGARFARYTHADVADLKRHLVADAGGRSLVMTDGVFSMDGDVAPLPELKQAADAVGAFLMVDDAHGFGVLGDQGRGSLEHHGLGATEVPVLMGTLGKACGTFGAFVAGSEALIETLIQSARTYIYTTATPPALAEAGRAALKLMHAESWRREKLKALIVRFREGAAQLDIELLPSVTAIQPLLVGESADALMLSRKLKEQGVLVAAIRPPTVPAGTARLRITLTAAHEEAHVDRLLDALKTASRH
ncbi:MAG TPA: 8-amino-7-oxononanoate synthase [Gammaproteobacteria bacterium]|nr:8-amino-7-oxononanoate synthase [Gammaproteobacteria bacterium]